MSLPPPPSSHFPSSSSSLLHPQHRQHPLLLRARPASPCACSFFTSVPLPKQATLCYPPSPLKAGLWGLPIDNPLPPATCPRDSTDDLTDDVYSPFFSRHRRAPDIAHFSIRHGSLAHRRPAARPRRIAVRDGDAHGHHLSPRRRHDVSLSSADPPVLG